MTAIAAVVHEDKIYVGCDSAAVYEDRGLIISNNHKVFINGDFIVGFTDSWRMGQILQYSFVPPKIGKDQDVMSFMVNDFANKTRECFKKYGYGIEDGEEGDIGGEYLIGFKSKLFLMQPDYAIIENSDTFGSVGCGRDVCWGSLYTTKDMNLTPENRIELALKSAQKYNTGVRSPFIIKKLG